MFSLNVPPAYGDADGPSIVAAHSRMFSLLGYAENVAEGRRRRQASSFSRRRSAESLVSVAIEDVC
jgi:hypothetical protein